MTRTVSLALTVLALLTASCGTVATPAWEAPEPTPTRLEAHTESVVQPTQTLIQPTSVPPTNTLIPPTATVTSAPPTETPVPPTPTTAAPAAQDPITVLVSLSNPDHGKELFNTFYDQAGFMCATCHRVDSEDRLIGPGQLNLATRAGTAGHQSQPGVSEAAERYIYNSITDPNLFIVADFPANLMPQVYNDIFSEQDIYDIIAYLLTLK